LELVLVIYFENAIDVNRTLKHATRVKGRGLEDALKTCIIEYNRILASSADEKLAESWRIYKERVVEWKRTRFMNDLHVGVMSKHLALAIP
jgi:hypothetical protein